MWTNIIKNLLNRLLLENGLRPTGRCAVIWTDICDYSSSSSSRLLPENFLILIRAERDTVINEPRSSCKVPVILLSFE